MQNAEREELAPIPHSFYLCFKIKPFTCPSLPFYPNARLNVGLPMSFYFHATKSFSCLFPVTKTLRDRTFFSMPVGNCSWVPFLSIKANGFGVCEWFVSGERYNCFYMKLKKMSQTSQFYDQKFSLPSEVCSFLFIDLFPLF